MSLLKEAGGLLLKGVSRFGEAASQNLASGNVLPSDPFGIGGRKTPVTASRSAVVKKAKKTRAKTTKKITRKTKARKLATRKRTRK